MKANMETLRVIVPDDGKNCPKPECGKREYLTRQHAGQTLSICPNGHSWDPIEVKAQQENQRRATDQERNYDFLRDSPITITPDKPAVRDRLLDRIQRDVLRNVRDGIFEEPARRSGDALADRRYRDQVIYPTFPTGVDPLKETAETKTAESIRMSRETYLRMPLYYVNTDDRKRLFGLPIVFDETLAPGVAVWTVEYSNPRSPYEWESFDRYLIKQIAVGLGLEPNTHRPLMVAPFDE